jgi:hypothetical protein
VKFAVSFSDGRQRAVRSGILVLATTNATIVVWWRPVGYNVFLRHWEMSAARGKRGWSRMKSTEGRLYTGRFDDTAVDEVGGHRHVDVASIAHCQYC